MTTGGPLRLDTTMPAVAKDHPPNPERPTARGHPIAELGLNRAEVAKLRAALEPFAELWDDPAMDVYDEPQARGRGPRGLPER